MSSILRRARSRFGKKRRTDAAAAAATPTTDETNIGPGPAVDNSINRSRAAAATAEQRLELMEDDMSDEDLRRFRAQHGLLGGTETIIDWKTAEKRAEPLKEGLLQLLDRNGSWVDARVQLWSSKVVVMERSTQDRTLDETMRRLPLEKERQVVIFKQPGQPVGISIKGGVEFDLPVLVSAVTEGSAAYDTRGFFVGDELLEVDGVSVEDMAHDEAADLLRSLATKQRVAFKLRIHPAARHRLLYEYLRSGNPNPLNARADKWRELIIVPLGYCYVARNQSSSSTENSFTVRAAFDVSKTAVLRPAFGSERDVSEWVAAIRKARDSYPTPPLRKPDPPLDFTGLVVRAGRVHEKRLDGTWRDVFLVLTDHDVSFYSAPPAIPSDLNHPIACYPLLAARFVSLTDSPRKERSQSSHNLVNDIGGAAGAGGPGSSLTSRQDAAPETPQFAIRLPNGVQHVFSAGLKETEKVWARLFRERTDQAVRTMNAITYSAFHRGEEVALTLNWQTGLWLNHDTRGDKSLIWHHPFAHLVGTSDIEETETVVLDFGPNGGKKRIQVPNPGMVVFVLAAFIACHVRTRQQLGDLL